MASNEGNQDGGSLPTKGAEAEVTGEHKSDDTEIEVDLAAKFAAFCDVRTKEQFTSKACNKLVKDCFDDKFKFKNVILTNRIDSSVFSKCKEKGKPHMVVNAGNCEKFLELSAHEFGKLKKNNDKLPKDDPVVSQIYATLKQAVAKSTGPKIKAVKPSASGNVKGLTDTTKYTGSHKLRFDETGKGRGKAGRADDTKVTGYVANFKGDGTYDKEKEAK